VTKGASARPVNPLVAIDDDGRRAIAFERAVDLSIPVDPGQAALAFSLPDAVSAPFRAGGFVGDVAQGGSVNCHTLSFCAHGNGTHTECVGHIVKDHVHVGDAVPYGPMPACVFTLSTTALAESGEHTDGKSAPDDRVVTARGLDARRRAIAPRDAHLFVVVLRLDDARGHAGRAWSGTNPPYFTRELCALLRAWGTHHVVVELPSLDREDDGGTVPAHHAFFGVESGARALARAPEPRTVTELAVVPDDVTDGECLLDLQVAPIRSDAAPSRPMLLPLPVVDEDQR